MMMLGGCDSSKSKPAPPPADPWAGTPGESQADPWASTPAGAPAVPAPSEPEPARVESGPLVGEWFQGSAGAEVLDASTNSWHTASGGAESWTFGPDGHYRHETFRLARLGSCTRRFLTIRTGRYETSGDTVTLGDRTGRVHAVSECSESYDREAEPDPATLRFGIDGPLLTLTGTDGTIVADRFARRR